MLKKRKQLARVRLLIPAILAMVALSGCERMSGPPPCQKSGIESAPASKELTAAEITRFLDGGEFALEPSNERAISGDLRPFWIVTGRISNVSSYDLKSVRIRITAYDKKTLTDLDTADFEVDDVPAHSTKAYRQEIQLMVKSGEFGVSYGFLDATTKRAN